MSNADLTMAVTGSKGRVMGNNPFSYAAPAGKEKPIFLDIAMSVVAGGKVNRAVKEGKEIPLGWLIDKNGNPSTNPNDFFSGGALLPFGGHKGYGLALIVEILAGVLTGNPVTKDIKSWPVCLSDPCSEGFFFIAIDIDSFMSLEEYKKQMDSLINQIRNSPRANGVERIYLPGEIEQLKEEAAIAEGIKLEKHISISLKNVISDLGLEAEFNSVIKQF